MNLKDRTRDFAIRVIRLCAALPSDRAGDAVARQLRRSGTSVGAHFREALKARSKSEYAAKLNGGLMELEETLYWLEIIEGAGFMTAKQLAPLQKESSELIAILVSLINKWRPKKAEGQRKAEGRRQKAEG